MSVSLRPYQPPDFQTVCDFLISHYRPSNRDGNWLQPAWEYMHSHPMLDETSLEQIGIWETAGEIVGVVHYESTLGEAFFQVHPDHSALKAEMLDYAENHLPDAEGRLKIFINDFDLGFEALAKERGYAQTGGYPRPIMALDVPQPFPKIMLPEGFQLKTLADDNDLWKVHRVLWRGFDHEGEPPEAGIEGRKKMQSTPNFRKDLTIVVEGPAGDFVSFCGMWYEPVNKYAYVEPVATDPDYRRMGLGKAAVLEGVRRCHALGATVTYVGSDQEFYKALGFRVEFYSRCWVR